MVDEIDDHVEGKILGLAIALREQPLIQSQALGQAATSPQGMYQRFESTMSCSRILVGTEIDAGPVHDHPDLPQVRLWMFDDPACHLAPAAWWHCLHRHERLECIRIVSLGLGA